MLARWLSVIVAAVALGVVACGGTEDQGANGTPAAKAGGKPLAGKTVKLGAIYPVTGPSAASGKGNRDGAEAAVEYLNGGGSLSGAHYELVDRDDQGNVTQ